MASRLKGSGLNVSHAKSSRSFRSDHEQETENTARNAGSKITIRPRINLIDVELKRLKKRASLNGMSISRLIEDLIRKK